MQNGIIGYIIDLYYLIDWKTLMEKKKIPLPGNRIIKSAVGVLLCYVIYILRGYRGIPFYSMLAVLWCIQPYSKNTGTNALQRSIGTLIGAAGGLVTLLIMKYIFEPLAFPGFASYILISFMIIVVLYTTVLLNKKNASYFSCVVFLSIAVVHIADEEPFIFVLNRVLDTFIGIGVGVLLSMLRMPRRRRKNILFITELDDMLAPVTETLTPYSRVEINRMLEDGLNFTVATMRTPASLMKPVGDINLKLPVIVMDGAALYDMKANTYLKAYVISNATAGVIIGEIRRSGINCFINALCDDTLMIYYDKLENTAERSIYISLKCSPYRNYIQREPSPADRIIYIMVIDETEKIKPLYEKLMNEYSEHMKILSYPSDDYPGFSYIKIYNKNADKKNMLSKLRELSGTEEYVTIGNRPENDIQSESRDLNGIVKTLKNTFEPLIWKKDHE